ncbi:questin oxidase family protein [Burkholderiaceae bacterium UC74_6]
MSPLAELHRQLDASLAFGPSHGARFSNHLPMALHAAWELGAQPERLAEQVSHEAGKLQPMPAPAHSGADDWRELLGRREAYADLRALIDADIQARGAEAVLRSHVPVLINSPHAALFHGMIRTAHAYESDHDGELGAALAYWASAWGMPPMGGEVEKLDFERWRACLIDALGEVNGRSFGESVRAATRGPSYAALADALNEDAHWVLRREALILLALDAYLASRNFVALHLITGLRAMRVLAPFVPDWPDVQAWMTRAFTAGWLGSGLVLRPHELPEAAPWPLLRQKALDQLDEHVLKLVHACWQEDRIRPDARWRKAAALALG